MHQKGEQEGGVPGNVSLAREIFAEYGDFLRIIIALHIQDETDADDFFQELFLIIALKPLPEKINSIKGFLCRLVSVRAKDFYRKKERCSHKIGRYRKIIKSKDAASCPEATIIEREQTDKMFELIRKNLPPKEAQAVTLKYKHDYDNKEIAGKMKINARSVSRYISVGISKIKTLWA